VLLQHGNPIGAQIVQPFEMGQTNKRRFCKIKQRNFAKLGRSFDAIQVKHPVSVQVVESVARIHAVGGGKDVFVLPLIHIMRNRANQAIRQQMRKKDLEVMEIGRVHNKQAAKAQYAADLTRKRSWVFHMLRNHVGGYKVEDSILKWKMVTPMENLLQTGYVRAIIRGITPNSELTPTQPLLLYRDRIAHPFGQDCVATSDIQPTRIRRYQPIQCCAVDMLRMEGARGHLIQLRCGHDVVSQPLAIRKIQVI